jgi:hypothetical protein
VTRQGRSPDPAGLQYRSDDRMRASLIQHGERRRFVTSAMA